MPIPRQSRLDLFRAAQGGARPRRGQRGFTLLEVLIALVIMSLGLSAMLLAAGGGMRAGALADRYGEAISRAKSHLDAARANPAPGQQEGDDGSGFRWRVQVRAADSLSLKTLHPGDSADTRVIVLYAITVWISWPEGARGRTVQLDSAHLATTNPS
jgi:general secretion pathway protein I